MSEVEVHYAAPLPEGAGERAEEVEAAVRHFVGHWREEHGLEVRKVLVEFQPAGGVMVTRLEADPR